MWKRRHLSGMRAFSVALFLFSIWPLVQAIDILTFDLSLKIFFMKVRLETQVLGSIALIIMFADITGNKRWRDPPALLALCIIPAFGSYFSWTSPNVLFRHSYFIDTGGLFPVLRYTDGILFPYLLFYSYLLFFIPLFLIWTRRRETSLLIFGQTITLFAALFLPLVTSALFQFGISPIAGFNFTPLTQFVSGIILIAGIVRHNLYDSSPFPRGEIVSFMKDGVVVLDLTGRIIDMNAAAQSMMKVSEREIVGKQAKDIFTKWCAETSALFDLDEGSAQIFIDEKPPRYFDLSLEPVRDKKDVLTNRLVILHDVTRNNMIEVALLRSEERYRNLFDMIDEGFCIIEVLFSESGIPHDYRYLEVNEAFEKHVGLSLVHGKLMRELVPDLEEYWFEIFGKVAKTGESARFIHEAKALGRWFHTYAYRVGVPEHHQVALIINDISTHKREQEELKRKEAELRDAQRVARLGSWYWDAKTKIMTGSDELLNIYGIDKTLEPKPTFREMRGVYYPVEDWERLNNAVVETLKTGIGYELDIRAFRNGELIYITTRSEVVRDESGQIIALRGTEQEITERKHLEESVSAAHKETMLEKKRLEAVIEALPIGLAISDFYSGNIRSNNAFNKIWGTSFLSEKVTIDSIACYRANRAWWADSGKPILPEEWASARAVLHGESVVGEEIRIERYSGDVGYILNSASPIFDIEGKIVGCVESVMDITDRRLAEERLKNFISVLSHEIRNPLAPVLYEVELLKMHTDVNTEIKESVDVIGRQVNTMANLLKDLLDVSRIERGKIELNKSETDISEIIRRAVETSTPLISEEGQHVSLFLPKEPVTIMADSLRLEQIMINLLNNASKYSNKNGHIEVILEKQSDAIVIKVKDDGMGIPRETLESIFALFSQNETAGHSRGGLGIGLHLSRELARLHGGDIAVKSEGLGKGSEFTVTLPFSAGK